MREFLHFFVILTACFIWIASSDDPTPPLDESITDDFKVIRPDPGISDVEVEAQRNDTSSGKADALVEREVVSSNEPKDSENDSMVDDSLDERVPASSTAAPPPYLPRHLVRSAKECTQRYGWTDDPHGIRSTSFVLDAGFEGGGSEKVFTHFGLNLKTHCNFVFFPLAPFDSIAVKVGYYRHICGNSLHLCLVDNSTISDIGRERPFFCGMQQRKHLLTEYRGRPRPCAAVVRDFFVPFPLTESKSGRRLSSPPLALVIQFHALHNPIENVTLHFTAHKCGETRESCREERKRDVEDARKTGFFPESRKLASRRTKRLSEGLRPGFGATKEAVADANAGVDEGFDASGKANGASASAVDGFWCSGTQLCIWKNSTCDGVDSCLDGGSDESDCEPETTTTTTTTTTTSITAVTATASSSMDDFKVELEAAAQNAALTNQSGTPHDYASADDAQSITDVSAKSGASNAQRLIRPIHGEISLPGAPNHQNPHEARSEWLWPLYPEIPNHTDAYPQNYAFHDIAKSEMKSHENNDIVNYHNRLIDPYTHENNEENWYWFYAFVTVSVITVVLIGGVIISLFVRKRRRGASQRLPTVNPFSRRASKVTAVDSREVGADVVEDGVAGFAASGLTIGQRQRPGSSVADAGCSLRRGDNNNAESEVAEEGFRAVTSGENGVQSGVKTGGFIRGIISKTMLKIPNLLPNAKTSPVHEDASAVELSTRVQNGPDSDLTVITISDNSISADRKESDRVLDRFKAEKFAAASTFVGRHPFRRDTPPPPPLSQRGKAAIDRVFLGVGEGRGGGRVTASGGGGRGVVPSDEVSGMEQPRPASLGGAPIGRAPVGDVFSSMTASLTISRKATSNLRKTAFCDEEKRQEMTSDYGKLTSTLDNVFRYILLA